VEHAPAAHLDDEGDADGRGRQQQPHEERVQRGNAEIAGPSPSPSDRARPPREQRLASCDERKHENRQAPADRGLPGEQPIGHGASLLLKRWKLSRTATATASRPAIELPSLLLQGWTRSVESADTAIADPESQLESCTPCARRKAARHRAAWLPSSGRRTPDRSGSVRELCSYCRLAPKSERKQPKSQQDGLSNQRSSECRAENA